MRSYPAVGPAIPHTKAGRSRVTHPFAGDLSLGPHDLHVLSTPPAFVLSQDQTLQEKVDVARSNSCHAARGSVSESLLNVRLNSPRSPCGHGSASPPRTSCDLVSVVNQLVQCCRLLCGSLSFYSERVSPSTRFSTFFSDPPARTLFTRRANRSTPSCCGRKTYVPNPRRTGIRNRTAIAVQALPLTRRFRDRDRETQLGARRSTFASGDDDGAARVERPRHACTA